MNILIPHKWLLEHLETSASPKEIQEHVSLSGPSVERIYERRGDKVYDIEVTTNRVDSMSVRGIAREAAVILSQSGLPSKLKNIDEKLYQGEGEENSNYPLPKVVNDTSVNKRIIFAVLANVKRNPTPDWMAERLEQTEMNVHDAVIDITNYVTHELGHPCHAFDYDKLMKTGGQIIITEAKKGETFQTLDDAEFTTVGGEVVFKNGQGDIIDLPSIKGTKNTSIDDSTKNVLLLLESIEASKVRFASMTHAIRTTAAQLMEKNVDPTLAEAVLRQGIKLYQELCEAKLSSTIYDEFPTKPNPQAVDVPRSEIERYLGVTLEEKEVVDILTALGCTVITETNAYRVTPPTFRPDITISADVIEEIARMYGYHRLPSVLMDTAIPTNKPTHTNFDIENRIKHFLIDIGWQEVYCYSMVSEELATKSGFSLEAHVKLANPLTDDKIYLRRSLLPSLEEIIDINPNRATLSVFEVAQIYEPVDHEIPHQPLRVGAISTKSYREVKGDIETLFEQFFSKLRVETQSSDHSEFSQHAAMYVGESSVGTIGVLKSGKVGCTIDVSSLLEVAKSHPNYQPIPSTMPIKEDLTFKLPEKTEFGLVVQKISELDPKLQSVELKDIYQNNATVSIEYLDPNSNLSSQDVEPIRKKIIDTVREDFQGSLVGEV